MKVSVYVAQSLDGFLAKSNGDISWLDKKADPNSSEDYGFANFLSSVDCLVMGRKTFEKVVSFGVWPYASVDVIVLSKSLKELPTGFTERAEVYDKSLGELFQLLEEKKYKHIYVDGGQTIQSFLLAGKITDIILTTIPVILGDGIPLFRTLPKEVWLQHISTKSYKRGFVQSRYQVESL